MGQYYRIALQQKGKKFTYSDRTVNGEYMLAKLTEHSWIGNSTVEAITKKLFEYGPTRVAWIGDYAEENRDYCPPLPEKCWQIVCEAWHIDDDDNNPDYFKDKTLVSDPNVSIANLCLVNHDKKLVLFGPEYFAEIHQKQRKIFWDKYDNLNKSEQQKSLQYYNWDVDMIPHPLSLLTAVGNGLGGGDYHGINEDKIGSWAFDLLEVVSFDEGLELINKGYKKYSVIFSEIIK